MRSRTLLCLEVSRYGQPREAVLYCGQSIAAIHLVAQGLYKLNWLCAHRDTETTFGNVPDVANRRFIADVPGSRRPRSGEGTKRWSPSSSTAQQPGLCARKEIRHVRRLPPSTTVAQCRGLLYGTRYVSLRPLHSVLSLPCGMPPPSVASHSVCKDECARERLICPSLSRRSHIGHIVHLGLARRRLLLH
jgi:hypothetical protein